MNTWKDYDIISHKLLTIVTGNNIVFIQISQKGATIMKGNDGPFSVFKREWFLVYLQLVKFLFYGLKFNILIVAYVFYLNFLLFFVFSPFYFGLIYYG